MSDEVKHNGRAGERVIRENQLDFLYNLYLQNVHIGDANIQLLKDNGLIKVDQPEAKKEEPKLTDNVKESVLGFTTDRNKEADSNVDIIFSDEAVPEKQLEIITDYELEERRKKHGFIFEGRSEPITAKDWLPESTTEHTPEFIEWINSITNLGFRHKKPYRKFTLYVQQAYTWLQERSSYTDFEDEDDRDEYKMNELNRCAENTLYFLNKYVYYKEGDDEAGRVKYIAAPVHEVMAFMNDSGYSFAITKGRQIAATTTLMACDVKDMVFKTNHFMKFITEDKDKAEEIFEDKLKFVFSELPFWMKPNVLNERDNLFKLGEKPEKGTKEGVGSKILVVAPKKTAVAGGAPQKVKIDEAGNIPILNKMINNARPTMLKFNPITKKLELKRQLIYWGTGGEMEKGGKAFETEFLSLLKQWNDGDYSAATVPLFFDWTCRPGADQAMYDNEMRNAYAKQGTPEGKDAIVEFHQSWPRSISDVFRSSAKTLVDDQYIEEAIERIRMANKDTNFGLIQRGYFEPVYDYTTVADENSDVPYKIIGAEFIPVGDMDQRGTVTIFQHPQPGWKNRYFQGTDPIDTDTGLSNMASTIWDKYHKCPAAILDWRHRDYRQVFLQTMLMGIYYDTADKKIGVKELVESNRGTSYTQYKQAKGFDREFVLNFQLSHIGFVNNSGLNDGIGIDNKGVRNTMIINRMFEMISAYGQNNYFEVFFEQLKTFTCNISDKGKEVWGPMNRKYFKDDVLFSTVFAYICAELVFPERVPENLLSENRKTVIKYKTVYDKNYNLVRVPVKVKA